jgi:ribosomal protein S18 acetylase RimI-like enzyme
MSSELTIRPYVSDDLAGLTRVYLESAEHHAALDPQIYRVPSVDEIRARYEGRIAALQVTLVAVREGKIVGFVDAQMLRSSDAMLRSTYYCHIAELAVGRECRSQGIGASLLQAAEVWGREHGAEVVSLDFHTANLRAADFYQQRMGYRVTSRTAVKIIT